MQNIFHFIRRFFWPLALVVAVVLLVLVYQAGRQSVYQTHPEFAQTEQANAILAKVGQLIQLLTYNTIAGRFHYHNQGIDHVRTLSTSQ